MPSSTCAWSGGTTFNYRGTSGGTSTTYGSLNTTEAMDANSAAVEITMGQPITLVSFTVVVDVGWDHLEHTGDWLWNILVDGVVVGSTCETKGVSQPASSKLLTCGTKGLSDTYVEAGSTISIRSYWSATMSWRDMVNDDVTWTVNYNISTPGTGG